MTDLIARLEAAEEGSRELSDKVLRACGWHYSTKSMVWRMPGGGECSVFIRPSPTESLDAALSLVPSGWIVARIGQGDDKTWSAELREGFCTSYNKVVIAPRNYKAPTPALALCVAILKAHQ